jgi:hypothetical protein
MDPTCTYVQGTVPILRGLDKCINLSALKNFGRLKSNNLSGSQHLYTLEEVKLILIPQKTTHYLNNDFGRASLGPEVFWMLIDHVEFRQNTVKVQKEMDIEQPTFSTFLNGACPAYWDGSMFVRSSIQPTRSCCKL